MDLNQDYLTQLHQRLDTNIENLRSYAEDNQVPIVDKLTLDMIKQLIRMNHTKQILEIGTAIGYSSMQFASVASDIEVTTLNATKICWHKRDIIFKNIIMKNKLD